MISTSAAFQAAAAAKSQVWIVNCTHVATDTEITVNSGSVILDATADARGRAEITVTDDGTHDPADPDDIFSPYVNELRIEVGYQLADGGVETIPLGVFGIDRVTNTNGREFSISLVDRARRILDAKFINPLTFAKDSDVDDNILAIAQGAWPSVPYDFDSTSATLSVGDVVANEQDSRWEAMRIMASADGKIVYFDRTGTLRLTPETPQSDPVLVITATDSLHSITRDFSRDPVANWVKVESTATNDSDVPYGIAADTESGSPTHVYSDFGYKPMWYANAYLQTTAQCENAANSLLNRNKGIAYNVSLEAIGAVTLDPLDVIRIEWEERNLAENHIVDSLTIPLSPGPTTIKTRQIQGGSLA